MSVGIFLDNDQAERANALHNILKNISGISTCPMCGGTGLIGVTKSLGGDTAWDGRYCELCNGVGFETSYYKDILFVCDKCNGTGHSLGRECSKCQGRGILDWVARARGV